MAADEHITAQANTALVTESGAHVSAAGTTSSSSDDAARVDASNEGGAKVTRRTVTRRRSPNVRRRQTAAAHGTGRARKTLGSMLRARRHDLRLTQREVAAKLDVKPAHIAYLELDHRRPSLSLLNRIAQVLDLDREKLILLSHPEARSFFSTAKKTEVVQPIDQAWREFKRNKRILNRYNISRKELKVLSQVALLGRVTTPRSFLFILNSIRQAVDDEADT